KKGGIVVTLALIILIIVGSYFFLSAGGITGAFIGLGSEPDNTSSMITLPEENTDNSVREGNNDSDSFITIPLPDNNTLEERLEEVNDTIINDSLVTDAPSSNDTNTSFTIQSNPIHTAASQNINNCTSLRTSGTTYLLTQPASNLTSCFEIQASHIELDCQGFNITYGLGRGNRSSAINNSRDIENVTIRNCNVQIGLGPDETNNGNNAFHFREAKNFYIVNNSITIIAGGNTAARGILLRESSHYNRVENNTILDASSSGQGILIGDVSSNNTIRGNNITTLNSGGFGIYLNRGTNYGNYIEGNIITSQLANAIQIDEANHTYLINNNISTRDSDFLIEDNANATNTVNFLIYNDSFVDLRWHNNGSGSFVNTLDLNGSTGIGLGLNIFLGNNTLAVNMSAFTTSVSKINSTVNITFRGLPFAEVDEVRRVSNFTADSGDIQRAGTNCLDTGGVTCQRQSYDRTNGILQFNATQLSSFSAIELGCFDLTRTRKLTHDVSNASGCFTVSASNITLDCQSYNLSFGTNGLRGSAVNSSGFTNVTIKNCEILLTNFTSRTYELDAIVLQGGSGHVLYNNTIYIADTNRSRGIVLSGANNSIIENNSITLNTSVGSALRLESAYNTSVRGNVINFSGLSVAGIALSRSSNSTIIENKVTANGEQEQGLLLAEVSSDNWIESNSFRALSTGTATQITNSSRGNTFLNTNFTSSSGVEINDSSGNASVNYLIYNNSFGEIRWTDENNVSTLTKMDVDSDGRNGLGLGLNLFIGNNSLAFNLSAFSFTETTLNASTNITLKGLPFAQVDRIIRAESFETAGNIILAKGSNCNGTSCAFFSYNSSSGELRFNTTGFSSFAASNNSIPALNSTLLNTTDITLNGTDQNLTFVNLTSDPDGDRVFVILNWFLNGTSITVLNLPFEGINNTPTNNIWDYSPYSNNGSEQGGVVWNSSGGFNGRGAYEFGVTNAFINLSSYPSNRTNNTAFSIEVQVRPTSLSGCVDCGIIKSVRDADGLLGDFILSINSTGAVRFFNLRNDGSDTDGLSFTADTVITGGNSFYHLVATWNGSENTIYVNGAEQTIIGTATTGTSFGAAAEIGRLNNTAGYYWNGTIDEVRIYNRSLSPEQVRALFQNRTNELVANETDRNNRWYVTATPNDGKEDGITIRSNNVTIRNSPPLFNETLVDQSITSGQTLSFGVRCRDPDLENVTYSDNTNFFDIATVTGTVTDTPTTAEGGSYNITITCSDYSSGSTSQTFIYTISTPSGGGGGGDSGSSAPAPSSPPPSAPAPPAEETPPAEGDIGFYTPPEVAEAREEGITLGEATVDEVGVMEAGSEAGGFARRGELLVITPNLTMIDDIEQFRKVRIYKIILENKGVKKMRLFPRLFQDIDDPFFIVTRKTLGYSDSLFERIARLSYSTTPVAGRLLEAEILNPEQIILEPGEKIEKIIEVKEGLATPDEIRIQFFTGEEVVFEQNIEVEAKIFSGTALDIDDDNNKIDIYTFIVPPFAVGKLEEYYAQSAITGAAVYTNVEQSDVYQLEITLRKKGDDAVVRPSIIKKLLHQLFGTKTYFADLYGPYELKKEQIFVFAQQ
ncbi:MAG: LamG-like jellyroll fold domain-containing protein, partial [Nanoarchaeota archaeon]|nr:LamG-like jellyroll fold domain-containing protein [Nanoarchaeota archaeon]